MVRSTFKIRISEKISVSGKANNRMLIVEMGTCPNLFIHPANMASDNSWFSTKGDAFIRSEFNDWLKEKFGRGVKVTFDQIYDLLKSEMPPAPEKLAWLK